MATERRRITITITPDIKPVIDRAKRLFYNRSQSNIIRTLIITGLEAAENKPQPEQPSKPPIRRTAYTEILPTIRSRSQGSFGR